MLRAVFNNKPFKILNEFQFSSSNSEVTFNDLVIDFTGYSIADIPFKFQEIQVKKSERLENILEGEVVFTGFLESINLSDLKLREGENRELSLTLLTPLKMATKRSVSVIGTYAKEEAVKRVLQPLIDDGFSIVELNIPDGQMTINYVIETIENCMNDICFKLNVFWFIDENKKIYINSIDYLFGLAPKKNISFENKEKGLLKIQPKIENIDYSNVINFKNVRIYYKALSICDELGNLIEEYEFPLLNLPKKIKKGDVIFFNNPIVIDETTLRSLIKEGEVKEGEEACLSMIINGEECYFRINSVTDEFMITDNVSFSDSGEEEKTFVLQRDAFFNNLITGFKWNGDDDAIITNIYSATALRYTTMRFMYSKEIDRMKGKISKSGIIEKIIDYNSKWISLNQLIGYARSLMNLNTNTINQVELEYDEDPKLKIGNIVRINEPDFFIYGNFAVKEITYNYHSELKQNWKIILKNADLNSTFIDMFRPLQKQESQNAIDTVILSEYVDENAYERHYIEVGGALGED